MFIVYLPLDKSSWNVFRRISKSRIRSILIVKCEFLSQRKTETGMANTLMKPYSRKNGTGIVLS